MKFLFDRKTHQNPAHHIIQHKILFRTTGVAIVAVDTPARHRNIRIYSLEIFFPTHLGNLDVRPNRVHLHAFQPVLLKLIGGPVLWIDGI